MTFDDRIYKLQNGSKTTVWAAKQILALTEHNANMREWIRIEGERTNTCTRRVLREKCSNCECKFKDE